MFPQGYEIDRYVVESLLGEGGSASVFRVRHRSLGTAHALKVLSVATARGRRRAIREARTQATLDHPFVVRVQDTFDENGVLAILMELVEGPSVQALMKVHRPTIGEVLRLFLGAVEGVACAHEQGLIHRDVKPANILIGLSSEHAVAKVADFGLVKILGGKEASETRTGMLLGTPAYQSPEQFRDPRSVTSLSDVFSLGCVLYEMVSGERAFVGDDLNMLYETMNRGEWVPLDQVAPTAPADVVAIVHEMMQPDASARPQSLQEVVERLDPLVESLPRDADLPAPLGRRALLPGMTGFAMAHRTAGAVSQTWKMTPNLSGSTWRSVGTNTTSSPVEVGSSPRWRGAVVGGSVLAIAAGLIWATQPPREQPAPLPAPTEAVSPAPEATASSPAVAVPEPAPTEAAAPTAAVAPAAAVAPSDIGTDRPASERDAVVAVQPPVDEEVIDVPAADVPAALPDGLWMATGGSERRRAEALAAIETAVGRPFAVDQPNEPEIVVAVGAVALRDSVEQWPGRPIVALDIPAGQVPDSDNVSVVPNAPDPAEVVRRLKMLIPGLTTIAGIRSGETTWWRDLDKACQNGGLALLGRQTDARNVMQAVDFGMARAEVILIRPDAELWTPDNLTQLFTAAKTHRAGAFPVVSYASRHLTRPAPPTMIVRVDPASVLDGSVALVKDMLAGRTPTPGYPALWLEGHSKGVMHAADGVRLTAKTEQAVDALAY